MCAIEVSPVVSTERLVLRGAVRTDAKRLAELANDFNVAARTVSIPHPYELADAERYLARAMACDWERHAEFVIEHHNFGVVGSIGFTHKRGERAEIGYFLGRRYWNRAGVSHKIELRIAPALDTLRALPAGERFDFAFIDADKTGYRAYYEEILARLRPNGLILFDNVLWMGTVLDRATTDESTCALRELNDALADDPRVESVMLAISDGLTIVRKRETR